MSKVDAQRAMREANYARRNAGGPTRAEATAAREASIAPAARTPDPKPARAAKAPSPASVAAPENELCGHKSMNGRACTREMAHPEKSHRYG